MAEFECTLLKTDSTTRVQWLKDNKPLEDRLADRITASATGKTFKLQIQNALESDSGIYIARAMNSDGQSTCTAQLVVQKRQSIKSTTLLRVKKRTHVGINIIITII